MASSDVDIARTVPCPACKRPADLPCVDLASNTEVDGVHQVRIYRAYIVTAAIAENRVIELTGEVERLRAALTAALEVVAAGSELRQRFVDRALRAAHVAEMERSQ